MDNNYNDDDDNPLLYYDIIRIIVLNPSCVTVYYTHYMNYLIESSQHLLQMRMLECQTLSNLPKIMEKKNQNMPFQNMPPWRNDFVVLKAFENHQMQEEFSVLLLST